MGGTTGVDGPGVTGGGIVPLLNSAHRGHLRFVSASVISTLGGLKLVSTHSCGQSVHNVRNDALYPVSWAGPKIMAFHLL
jgi:hypothetical protein